MPDYRRAFSPGGTFFFTLVTERRAPILCTPTARAILHEAIASCRETRPFSLEAIVLLPDHLHAIWTLPPGDSDFSSRWASIKAAFSRKFLATGGPEQPRTGSRVHNRRRGVWQRRFWEHQIRDERDLERHLHYIHYNPVKHGMAQCPHAWPHSTFAKWVRREVYAQDWLCQCDGRHVTPPTFERDMDDLETGE